MSIYKILLPVLAAGLIFAGCNTEGTQQTGIVNDNANLVAVEDTMADSDEYWAKDNFDLQRAGAIFERSESPAEFERYLNEPGGVNNLDLNGDGYVDYISVREFDDREDGQRGLSLFTRFGPDLIQEVASILLYRDEPRYPGARVYLRGDERIYGDNHYYETNWLDRSLGLVSTLFGDRDERYQSPYYYDNYPDYYEPYQVVEPAYYQTRVVQLYPEPAFVYTTAPQYIDRIKIKSPNNGLHLGQIKARLVKPSDEQAAYYRNNRGRPAFAPGRDVPPGQAMQNPNRGPGNSSAGGRPVGPDNAPGQQKQGNPGKGPDKPDDKGKGSGKDDKGGGKPDNPGKGQGKP
ncbi:MAG TPA: hypothetical protein VK918_07015 [Pyrinomonadaceae bacterium]|nr:hypothetical protein [Pyrinomonadaceae bacterium]